MTSLTDQENERLCNELAAVLGALNKANAKLTELGHPPIDDNVTIEHLRYSVLLKPLKEIEWSARTGNCLENRGLSYVWQLAEKTEAEMLKTQNFGRKSLNEVKDGLADLELTLGMKFKPEDRAVLVFQCGVKN